MSELEIKNVGAVSSLALTVPAGGGVVVLRGRNGCGKSTAIEAAQALIRGKGALPCRDGASKGEVNGWGARITVGRHTRRSGELDVVSLEGRLDIAQLVDPGIADPAAADARRIKALASLTGAAVDRQRFAQLFGGPEQLDAIAPGDLGDDLVEAAARVKRAAEAEARKREAEADGLRSKAAGLAAASDDLDLSADADPTRLQADLERAIAEESRLAAERKAAEAALRKADDARQAMAKHGGASYVEGEISLEKATQHDAVRAVSTLDAQIEERLKEIASLQTQLGKLRSERDTARTTIERSASRIADLTRTQAAMDGWTKSIAAAEQCNYPSDDELSAAAAGVTRAREAIERGAEIRRAKENAAKATAMKESAMEAARAAELLRDAARATDGVLSDAVASGLLRVDAGRLVTDTSRGQTEFGDLSHGERWAIALRIAAERVGKNGIIPVPQEAWECLDPDNRAMIAGLARTLGVVILTAEADSGELRAEEFDPEC